MAETNYYLLSVIAFVALLAVVLYRDRANIERKFAILFMRRTQKGKVLVERLVKPHPKFWALMGDAGIVSGFGAMAYGVYYLLTQALAPQAGPGLALVLPSASATATAGYGYLAIPFWFFMISLAALFIIHEGFHALQVRSEGVRIKSMGLLLLAIIPGAFVEPDEKALRKKSWRAQARVYAAGSFGNFLLAIAAALILTYGLSPIFSVGAIGFTGYVNPALHERTEPYPAQLAELTSPILVLDGQRVESVEQFAAILSSKRPGDTVLVETAEGIYQVRLAAHPEDPERPFLGVENVQPTRVLKDEYRNSPLQAGAITFVLETLAYVFFLSLSVGVVNLLPVRPLDGGPLMEVVLKRFVPRYADDVMRASAAFIVILIFWNLFGGLII